MKNRLAALLASLMLLATPLSVQAAGDYTPPTVGAIFPQSNMVLSNEISWNSGCGIPANVGDICGLVADSSGIKYVKYRIVDATSYQCLNGTVFTTDCSMKLVDSLVGQRWTVALNYATLARPQSSILYRLEINVRDNAVNLFGGNQTSKTIYFKVENYG